MYDYFGYSVAIDGNTIVIGAYGDDDAGDSSGSAYVFSGAGSEGLVASSEPSGGRGALGSAPSPCSSPRGSLSSLSRPPARALRAVLDRPVPEASYGVVETVEGPSYGPEAAELIWRGASGLP